MRTKLPNFAVVSFSLISLLAALPAQNAQAISLANLLAGETITVLDKTFDNWMLIDNPNGIDLTLIDVSGLDDDFTNPGLKYTSSGALSATDLQVLTLDFKFDVSTINSRPLIQGGSLELTDFTFSGAGGAVGISESISDTSNSSLADLLVFADNNAGVSQLVDSDDFSSQSQITVMNSLQLISETLGETTSINMFEQRFSQDVTVPEPNTLLGLGLLGLGAVSSKKFRRK